MKPSTRNLGHTKTLFKEGGKFKWARRYEHCLKCKTTNHKHQGSGLCSKCYISQAKVRKYRNEQLKKYTKKYKEIINIRKNTYMKARRQYDNEYRLQRNKIAFKSFSKNKEKNIQKEELKILLKSLSLRKILNKKNIILNIEGKQREFPFENLDFLSSKHHSKYSAQDTLQMKRDYLSLLEYYKSF